MFSEKAGIKKACGSSAELESTAFDRENSDESSLRNHKIRRVLGGFSPSGQCAGAKESCVTGLVIASRTNVHRTYISYIELGKVSMGIEIAHALASALGMKLSELVRKAE